ncbi:transmembrane protein 180-like [Glandiceps talaboti]
MMALHTNTMAYVTAEFAFNMMSSVYTFYYVNLFLNIYRISEDWFNAAQFVYLIWNAVNDPLFAYFQDNSKLFKQRRYSVLYGAPLFALTFLLPWFRWADYQPNSWIIGVHLFLSLFLYDTLFTFVGLAMCALYTEMSHRHEDRLRLTTYGQVGSILGCSGVFLCEVFSDGLNKFGYFQCLCILFALLSWLSLRYTGMHAETDYDNKDLLPGESAEKVVTDRESNQPLSMWKGYWQIISQGNVFVLVTVNFCTEFHMTYGRNFLSIFGTELIPRTDLSDISRKILYGSVFILPQICVLLLGQVVRKVGAYEVYRLAFVVKMTTSFIIYIMGSSHTLLLAVFFLIDMTFPSVASRYFNILMADCVDDDMKKYNRESPLSSMFFGMNALFIKPAQSLAPIFIVHVLNKNGYQEAVHGLDPDPSVVSQLHDVMFQVACMVPLVLGIVQYLLWTKYSLRDSHIVIPKYMESCKVPRLINQI